MIECFVLITVYKNRSQWRFVNTVSLFLFTFLLCHCFKFIIMLQHPKLVICAQLHLCASTFSASEFKILPVSCGHSYIMAVWHPSSWEWWLLLSPLFFHVCVPAWSKVSFNIYGNIPTCWGLRPLLLLLSSLFVGEDFQVVFM